MAANYGLFGKIDDGSGSKAPRGMFGEVGAKRSSIYDKTTQAEADAIAQSEQDATNVAKQQTQQAQAKLNPYSLGSIADSFKTAVGKVIVDPAVSIAKGVAEQAGHAVNELSATPLNVFGPKPQDVIESTSKQIHDQLVKGGMSEDKASMIADQVRTKGYDQFLKDSGIGINDSPITIGRKAVGNIGGTVTNFLPVGQALRGTSLVGRVMKSALFGGVAGGVGNLANDNLTPQNEAEAVGAGALVGGALPPLAEGARQLGGRVTTLLGKPVPENGAVPLPKGIEQPALPPRQEVAPAPTEAVAAPPEAVAPKLNVQVNADLVKSGKVGSEIASVPSQHLTITSDAVDSKSISDYTSDIKAGRTIEPIVVTRGDGGKIFVQEGRNRLQAIEKAGISDIPVVEQRSAGAVKVLPAKQAPAAAPATEKLPPVLQDLQDKLPDGYKVNSGGDVYAPDGHELKTGELQDLTQAPYLSEFEKASRDNDVATMNRIAKEHPGDNRVAMGSIQKEPALKSLTKNIEQIKQKNRPQGSLPPLNKAAKADLIAKARATVAAEAPAKEPAATAQPQGKTEQVPELPKGYLQDEAGAIFDPQGKVMKFGDVQKLAQTTRGEAYLTEFENASKAGDTVTMKKIAAEHPTDDRLKVPETTKPDTTPIKNQIKELRANDKNYDEAGNIKPEIAKQVTALNKQLNTAGERVPKAEKPVTVEPIKAPEAKTVETGKSALAASTEQKAIAKKLTDGFEGTPEYAKMNVEDQAAAATKLLKEDPAQALRVALGRETPPGDLLPESVYIAVENKALKDGNVDVLRQLSTESNLSTQASGMGQRIRMLGERDPTSPVEAMRKLKETREAAVERRTGKSIDQHVSEEVKAIRAAKPKLTKVSWNSFVESLKC